MLITNVLLLKRHHDHHHVYFRPWSIIFLWEQKVCCYFLCKQKSKSASNFVVSLAFFLMPWAAIPQLSELGLNRSSITRWKKVASFLTSYFDNKIICVSVMPSSCFVFSISSTLRTITIYLCGLCYALPLHYP